MTLHFVIRTKHDFLSRRERRLDSTRIPVYVRIKDGKEIDQTVRTSILVNPQWWDVRFEELSWKSSCPEEEIIQTNEALAKLRSHIISTYLRDRRNNDVPSSWLQSVFSRYCDILKNNDDVVLLINRYCTEKKLSTGRKASYLMLGRALLCYEAYRKNFDDITYNMRLNRFNVDFLNSFHAYLGEEANLYLEHMEFYKMMGFIRRPRPRSQNTISDLFKKLRAFFNWYAQKGYIKASPFIDFRIPREIYGTPVCLTKEEVIMIRDAEMPSMMLEEYRDLFVFQCNVGCRVGDLMRLKRANVVNGELSFIPSKGIRNTGRRVLVPLNGTASSILVKYGSQPGERILPYGTIQQYNCAIKRILRIAGVDRLVTILDPLTRSECQKPIYEVASSHMARRTFINNLYGHVKDAELVASLTGHAEGSRSFLRYREIGSDIKRDLVSLLE